MSLLSPAPLLTLPSELILHILSFLDVPELLSTSRVILSPPALLLPSTPPLTSSLSQTTHQLRHLCLDPILHTARLVRASLTISRSIPCRPPLSELVQHRIYVTKTSFAARSLGRNLIKIKLNRSLLHRPSPERLVEQGVLPPECLQSRIAPSLISTKRRIEKEKVKDVLRHWVEEWRRKGSRAVDAREERLDVGVLVRRFAREGQGFGKGRDVQRWGGQEREREKEQPARAKVLGLRRFWERIGRDGVVA